MSHRTQPPDPTMIAFNHLNAAWLDHGIPISWRETPAERKPVHGMAIVYANAAARMKADQLCSRLIQEVGDDVLWQKHYLDMDMLGIPGKRREATELATAAEVVVLALDDDRELSEAGKTWMEEWVGHLFDRGPVLIATYDDRPHHPRRAPVSTQSFLEKIAESCGLTFLYTQGEALVEHRPAA